MLYRHNLLHGCDLFQLFKGERDQILVQNDFEFLFCSYLFASLSNPCYCQWLRMHAEKSFFVNRMHGQRVFGHTQDCFENGGI